MAGTEYFQWLERVLNYDFRERSLLEKALTGPGAEGDKEGTEEERVRHEGNRFLGALGRSLLSVTVDRRLFSVGKSGEVALREALDPVHAHESHVKRAKELSIDHHMKLSPRTRGKAEPRTIQLTIYAIVGAVWQDCNEDFSCLDIVIDSLFISSDTSTFIDPQQMSLSEFISTELLDDHPLNLCSTDAGIDSALNFDLIGSSAMKAKSQSYSTASLPHSDHQLDTGLGNGQDLPNYDTFIFDNEDSLFPDDRLATVSKSKRGQASNDVGNRSTPGLDSPKKRKLSTKSSESRLSIQLDNYISLEKTRCESYAIPFTWADIDSQLRALSTTLKETDFITIKALSFVIGSPESLVALQEIIKVHRTTPVEREISSGSDISLTDRIRIIEGTGPKVAYLVLQRRCNIYHVFHEFSKDSRKTSDGFVVDTTQSVSRQGAPKIGNPINLEDSRILEEILKEVYPNLKPDTEIYMKKKRFIRKLRKLGERFDLLVKTFGYGILGLLSCPGSELDETAGLVFTDELLLSLSDAVFKSLVLYLKQTQGEYLTAVSNTVSDVVTALFQASLGSVVAFPLEKMESSKILAAPKSMVLVWLITQAGLAVSH